MEYRSTVDSHLLFDSEYPEGFLWNKITINGNLGDVAATIVAVLRDFATPEEMTETKGLRRALRIIAEQAYID